MKTVKKLLYWFQAVWKQWTKDYLIVVKAVKLVSAHVLIIDFTADDVSYYITIHGDYKKIRTKFLQKNTQEPISFEDYMEEINLLVPTEDIIKHHYKSWIIK